MKMTRILSLLFIALIAGTCVVAAPSQSSDYPTPYFWLAPYAPSVPSIKGFTFMHYPTVNTQENFTVRSAEWEIRDAFSGHLIARFPAVVSFYNNTHDERPPHEKAIQYRFEPEQIQAMSNPHSGTFLMAFIINGVRASNVIRFKIGPTLETSKEPVLRAGMLEAPPGQDCGDLVTWVVGPTPQDPRLTNDEVAFADILVDGQLHREDMRVWTGPAGPYPPGEPDVRPFDSPERLKGVDLHKPHQFQIQVGKYLSDRVTLSLKSHALADQWDKANTGPSDKH